MENGELCQMPSYTKLLTPTPQSKPLTKDQVINNASGFVYSLDKFKRLERFLILGSDSATYYSSAKDLTRDNANVVAECWFEAPYETARLIEDISVSGRAPKNDPAIFALALGTICDSVPARQAAFSTVPAVCRTASFLYRFMEYATALGKGTGRGMKRVLASWYDTRSTDNLALQMVKYRQRYGFTHKRLIELSNKGAGSDPQRQALYRWARGKDVDVEQLPKIVQAHFDAMTIPEGKTKDLVKLIKKARLPAEALPTWALKSPAVWEAMIPHAGMTNLIRNLGVMTSCEAITSENWHHVADRLVNEEDLHKSRVHPYNLLLALSIYKSGHGMKGKGSWSPVSGIIDALDEAFYKAFQNVEPTGKRILIALDVSGSMGSDVLAGSPITAREASSALAMITLAREPHCTVVGFTSKSGSYYRTGGTELIPLDISARRRLDDICKYTATIPFGGTDCSLPFIWATEKKKKYDAVILYTDNETWAGYMHPTEALKKYRRASGLRTKSVVCAMTSTGFTIADPNDGDMLDIVGCDSAVPRLISDFIK
jgi:60 kDa SS-A/Ro ribonucleoprotein